jgi:RNA 2',3'-cyclic 3'-phosphodiesterase
LKHRLFVAIDIPTELFSQIHSLQSRIDKLKLPVTWQPQEKIHLTTNFLGDIADETFQSVRNAIKAAIVNTPPFQLTPYFLETLYSRHEPAKIYLAPSGDIDILTALQSQLNFEFAARQLPQQPRFLPHITIGHLKKADPTTTKSFLDELSRLEFSPLTTFTVDHITLYESLISQAGSHFQRVSTFKFSSETPL